VFQMRAPATGKAREPMEVSLTAEINEFTHSVNGVTVNNQGIIRSRGRNHGCQVQICKISGILGQSSPFRVDFARGPYHSAAQPGITVGESIVEFGVLPSGSCHGSCCIMYAETGACAVGEALRYVMRQCDRAGHVTLRGVRIAAGRTRIRTN